MKVKLINSSLKANDIMYVAARTCYSALGSCELAELNQSQETCINLVEKILDSGHLSIAEHINFTFAIDGVSRACTHQFVRHRHASFSQKSQRYVKEKTQFEYAVPFNIQKNPELLDKYNDLMAKISEFYIEMTEANIPAEDARSVLPNAALSSLVVTMNLRELMHLANMRLCKRAQKEIRQMTKMMCDEVIKVPGQEWLSKYLQPQCVVNGFCKEHKSCGYIAQVKENSNNEKND